MTYHIAKPKFFSWEMFIIFAVVLLIIGVSSFVIYRNFRRTLEARKEEMSKSRRSSFMHRLGIETNSANSYNYHKSEDNDYRRGGSDADTPRFMRVDGRKGVNRSFENHTREAQPHQTDHSEENRRYF
jgi:hypothetical protein